MVEKRKQKNNGRTKSFHADGFKTTFDDLLTIRRLLDTVA